MHKCNFCGKEFEKGISLGGHVSLCKLNPNKIVRNHRKERIQIVCKCIVCGIEFKQIIKKNGSNLLHKCCSSKCSHKRIHTNETKKKISNSVKNKNGINLPYIKACKFCNNEFKTKKKNVIFCTRSCARKYVSNLPENKKRISELFKRIALERHKNGDPSIGWKSRINRTPSYPEKITIQILDKLGIEYKREYPVGKYNLDFAFLNKMIDLEIDGKQHENDDRKLTDNEKEKFISLKGWKTIRIKWINDYKHGERVINILKNAGII